MRTAQQAAAATAAVLAAVVLAGCQPGGSTAGSATPGSGPPSSVTHSGPATAASPAAPGASPAGAAAGPPRCHSAGLGITLGAPRPPGAGQQTMSLTFTNTSAAACSIDGFPGVNLVARGFQWALQRQSSAPRRIVLPPGGRASSTLTLLRWAAGDGTSFAPTQVYVTPPDETAYRTLPWPSGVVLIRQDEATHPGTFIGPVG
jgi:hypothetical protein